MCEDNTDGNNVENNLENDDDADMIVQEEEIEKLREEVIIGEKVIPILEAFCNNTNDAAMVLQVLEIIKTDDGYELRLSDGQVWIQGSLNRIFFPNIALGMLRKFDIIKDVVLTGDFLNSKFFIESFCRPKSIQLPVQEIIGAPVSLFGSSNVNAGRKSKKPRISNLDDIFNDR